MTSAVEYIKEHYWVWVVAGVIVLLIIASILILCCVYCVHRRRKRRHGIYYVNLRANLEDSLRYGTMEMTRSLNDSHKMNSENHTTPNFSTAATATGKKQEEGVAEAWTNQRKRRESSEREAAQLTCQYYLRNARSHTLSSTLPDLGSRVAKYWFLVTPSDVTGQSSPSWKMILTLLPVSRHCPIKLQRDNLKLLNKLLATIQHPYLYSVEHVDYLPEQSSIVMVMTFFPQGSLKDVIYKRQPTLEWSDKYSIRRRGLPPETVALYGRQILEALRVLYRKGLPPLGNLQCGNIFMDGKVCRLSGYENTLLGYRSRHYKLVRGHPDVMDTIMFGHVLFEMMCGYELTTLSPSNSDWANVKNQEQLEVLRYVFSGTEQEKEYPNIVEILCLPYFKSVKLPEIENWESSQIQLSSEMKGLLRGVRKGRSDSTLERQPSKQRTFSSPENYYPVTQAPHVIFKPPPPPSSLPPDPSRPPPSSSEGRGALLSDIRSGTELKRTITNDRSAPII